MGVSPRLKLEVRKVEDQDSDYESMSSDSSVKRESLSDTSLVCKSDSEDFVKVVGQVKEEEAEEEEEAVVKVEEEGGKEDMDGLRLCPTSGIGLLFLMI